MDNVQQQALANAALQGGLPDMKIPTEQPPTQATEPQPSPTTKKYYVGGKEFDSSDAAIAYADGLTDAQVRAASAINNVTPQPAPVTPENSNLGQILFEDPEKALKAVKDQAKAEMRAEQNQRDENKKFWEDFYQKHSDLKGSEFLVDSVLNREQQSGNFNGLTKAQASPILAAKAREELHRIRGASSGGQALPSAQVVTTGASGAPTPVPQPAPLPTTTFVDEIRGLRKRG